MASIYFSKTKCYNVCLRKFNSKTSDIHTFAHPYNSKVAESGVAKWLRVE